MNIGKPKEDLGNPGNDPTELHQRGAASYWEVAALNHFVSRSMEKCLPFFKMLKQPRNFQWTIEAHQAFEELKKYLGSMPLLSKPELGEEFYLYLAMFPVAISTMLVREEGKSQRRVYYIIKVLHDIEFRYTRLEKFIFVLIVSTRKL